MSRFILAAFAFMAIFSVATADRCPGNEVYKDCGSACPPSCDDDGPRYCTLQCVAGCFCRDGFVKNSNGKCVPRSACKNADKP